MPKNNDEYSKECERKITSALIRLIKIKEQNFRYVVIKEILRMFPPQRNKLAEMYYQKLFNTYLC